MLTAVPPRVLARWGAAVVVVVAVHGAAVWLAMHWRSAAVASGEPPPAVMIDLAPMSVAPEAPPQDVAPGPQMTEAQPERAPEPSPPPPEPDVKVPDLPKADDAAATLTPPPPEPPKPEPPKEAEHKPKPPPKKPVERKKPREHADHAAPRNTAPPPAQRAERAAAAAGAGASSSAAAAASWRSELMAHLNRYKRFPSGAGSGGVATIAFTINRSGQVTGSRLLRSSGDSVLDAEAVALPRRASPVPAPPPGTGGSSIGLAVPIRFSR
ncbi:MAG: energy transducer TonB family protein [Xanthobacteraceae bacterium]